MLYFDNVVVLEELEVLSWILFDEVLRGYENFGNWLENFILLFFMDVFLICGYFDILLLSGDVSGNNLLGFGDF